MLFGKSSEKLGRYVGIDVGASALKFVELELGVGDEKPILKNYGFAPLKGEIFSNNQIAKRDYAAEVLSGMLAEHQALGCQAICAIPGAAAFLKRMKVPKVPFSQLDSTIRMEAGNLIPHNLDSIKLDYHISGVDSRGQVDCLLVAIKEEVLESFADTFDKAGIALAVVDVEYFALQNAFELAHPELLDSTTAVVDVGHRYSAVSICRKGDSLFTGEISSGGRSLSEVVASGLGVAPEVAINVLKGDAREVAKYPNSAELVAESVKQMATEFNRQLTFFWSASGADDGIDQIVLTGGASKLPGLVKELSAVTGLKVMNLNPLNGIALAENTDRVEFEKVADSLVLAIGLALRRRGDRDIPEIDND